MSKEKRLTEALEQINNYQEKGGDYVLPFVYLMKAETVKFAYTSDEALLDKLTLGEVIHIERRMRMIPKTLIDKMEGVRTFRNYIAHDVIYATDLPYILDDVKDAMKALDSMLEEYFNCYNLRPVVNKQKEMNSLTASNTAYNTDTENLLSRFNM